MSLKRLLNAVMEFGYNAAKNILILKEATKLYLYEEMYLPYYDFVFDWLFQGIPEHYPFKKKLVIFRANSKIGDTWDVFQIVIVILACVTYAYTRYSLSYEQTVIIFLFEMIITQFFMLDFILNFYLASSIVHFFMDYMTVVDILTMVPVYIVLFSGTTHTVYIFRMFPPLSHYWYHLLHLFLLSLPLCSATVILVRRYIINFDEFLPFAAYRKVDAHVPYRKGHQKPKSCAAAGGKPRRHAGVHGTCLLAMDCHCTAVMT